MDLDTVLIGSAEICCKLVGRKESRILFLKTRLASNKLIGGSNKFFFLIDAWSKMLLKQRR